MFYSCIEDVDACADVIILVIILVPQILVSKCDFSLKPVHKFLIQILVVKSILFINPFIHL